MIDKIAQIVETACKKDTNFFGYNIWTHHILLVVKYAKVMATKLGANEEIVEIAALLHDYAGIKDYSLHNEHHLHGAIEAENILKQFNYPQHKIEQVKECIFRHRGSVPHEQTTKETMCVTDGDAMAHFDSVPALLYVAYMNRKMSIDEACEWLRAKLERSWNKLSLTAKQLTQPKYEASQMLLNHSNSIHSFPNTLK